MTAMGANADEAAPMRKAERRFEVPGFGLQHRPAELGSCRTSHFWLHGIRIRARSCRRWARPRQLHRRHDDIAVVAARPP